MCLLALQLTSCGKSNEQVAKERADSLMSARKGIYDVATSALKKQLKFSSTAKFASVTLENADTAAIFLHGDSALVRGEYDAQNGFGTYEHGKFQVRLLRVSGKWVCPKPEYPSLDVRASFSREILRDPDWAAEFSQFGYDYPSDKSLKVDTSHKH
jgi:hypothetical protein